MSERLKRNAPLLRALYHAKPAKRKTILKHSSADFIRSLCEISLNVLKGNIPLSDAQYKKLKKQKTTLKLLANKKIGIKRKHKALVKQSGGFLLPLLSVVAPIVGDLIGGLIRKR